MNIFTAIKTIFNALTINHNEMKEDREIFRTRQATIIQEKRYKALLMEQLLSINNAAIKENVVSMKIQIADECLPYVKEIESKIDASLFSLGDGIFLMTPAEVFISDDDEDWEEDL